MAASPKADLIAGADIIGDVMKPSGFSFEFRDEGRGSGGHFAWGEFVRGERRLELHFRGSLGMVKYHLGKLNATHETFMRELGILGCNQYPGFSENPLDGFRHLAHDLQFASDFLSGSAAVLRAAALKQAEADQEDSKRLLAGYVGDTRALEQMQSLFRAGQYAQVLSLSNQLHFPERLTATQKQMVKVARERAR